MLNNDQNPAVDDLLPTRVKGFLMLQSWRVEIFEGSWRKTVPGPDNEEDNMVSSQSPPRGCNVAQFSRQEV